MQCRAVCCQPHAAIFTGPPAPSEFSTDFASLEQQALAAPRVRLVEQAEWYRGLTTPMHYKELGPRVRQAMHICKQLLIQEEDVMPGELPLALPAFGGSRYTEASKPVVQHDLVVRPTESGYQATMVDVNADLPGESLFCAAPLFGIWVQPKGQVQAALLPLYLVWWLNAHQPPCENPEALIQSFVPLPPVALQRELIALLL